MYTLINGWTLDGMIEILKHEYKGQAWSNSAGTCQYLTNDGKKCAVGCFIPDGHSLQKYHGSMRYMSEETLGELNSLNMPLNTDGLFAFQEFHDSEERTLDEMIQWVNENVKGDL